jgi:hypothetical protein
MIFARFITVLALLVVLPIKTASSQSITECPPPHSKAEEMVESYLAEDQWSDNRTRHGVSASTGEVRVLTEEHDSEACGQLIGSGLEGGPYRDHSFYASDAYYFLVTYVRPPSEWPEDRLPAGRAGIIVFDGAFDVVTIVMM